MLKNRVFSFIILIIVYAIAIICGIYLFPKFPFDYRISLLLTDVISTIIVFIFSLIFKNASVYDPYWSVQPIVIVTAFAITQKINLLGLLFIIVIFYWGIRLTSNWAYTFKNLTCQDWRYTMLHEKTGKAYPIINFIGIHMVPTLVVYLCTLPAVVSITEKVDFNPLCIPTLIISTCATTIQMTADIQMHTFRKNKTKGLLSPSESTFIRNGFWKHGRHPNYFGEIMMWWGIGLTAVLSKPENWYLLAGAFANTLLFFCVSIPLAEQRQSKKEGFAEYKKQTRILI